MKKIMLASFTHNYRWNWRCFVWRWWWRIWIYQWRLFPDNICSGAQFLSYHSECLQDSRIMEEVVSTFTCTHTTWWTSFGMSYVFIFFWLFSFLLKVVNGLSTLDWRLNHFNGAASYWYSYTTLHYCFGSICFFLFNRYNLFILFD